MFDWEALKQPSQRRDQLLPCLHIAGRKSQNTQIRTRDNLYFLLCSNWPTRFYMAPLCFFLFSAASSRKQETTKNTIWLICKVMSFYRAWHKHTKMHIHSQKHGHTHSGVFVIPSWDRQTPPVHHSPVHFIDLSSFLDKSTSPGWLICTRLAVLADSGCHVDSISDVTQWSLKRAVIGMETSHTKERHRQRWKERTWGGGERGILFILNSLKLLQKLKDDCRHSRTYIILYVCLCVCVLVLSRLPSRKMTLKALGLTQGTAHLSLAQKPSPCLRH